MQSGGMDWVTSLRSHIKNGKVLWKYSVSSQRLLKFDLSLLERSLIRWDSFIMKLNTMLRNNIQCAILTTKFILYIFTLLLPFSLPFFTLFFFFSLFLSFFFYSEDDYRTSFIHCQQQQSYSGLRSPGRSYSTNLWKFMPQSL